MSLCVLAPLPPEEFISVPSQPFPSLLAANKHKQPRKYTDSYIHTTHSGKSGREGAESLCAPKLSSNNNNNEICLMSYVCVYVTCMCTVYYYNFLM